MRFAMDPGVGRGNGILIRGKVGKKDALFLLDTGATRSVLDLATEGLGNPLGTVKLASASSTFQIKNFLAPPMEIGDHAISFNQPIFGSDLQTLREVSGQPITGVLGMDFLSRYVLQLDFKNRQVLFLAPSFPAPQNSEVFTIGHSFGMPVILANFLIPDTVVRIDTGCIQDGIVRPTFVETLGVPFSRVHSPTVEATGVVDQDSYIVRAPWTLAGTDYAAVVLSPGMENAIGLRILANYIVTLDFPHDRAYFQSIRHDHPAPLRDIGFGIIIRGGLRIVGYVDKSALTAGLKKDDQILSIDSEDVNVIPVWQLHERIAIKPKSTLTVRRKLDTMEIIVGNLKKE